MHQNDNPSIQTEKKVLTLAELKELVAGGSGSTKSVTIGITESVVTSPSCVYHTNICQ